MYDENGGEPGDGWKPITLTIPGKDGMTECPCLAHGAAPGVAIAVWRWGVFTVTHRRTGMRLNGPFERAANAAVEAAQWAEVFDLDAAESGDDLMKQIDADPDTPVPFAGATTTAGGEKRPMTRQEWFRSTMAQRYWIDEFPFEEASPWEIADQILGLAAATEEA